MTTPLTDQIRDYFADIETQQGAIDVDALFERESSRLRMVDGPSTPTTPVRAHWWAGLVAAATVVALVAGLVIMRSADDSGPADGVIPTIDGTSPVTSDGSRVSVPTTDPPVEPAPDAVTNVTVEWPAGDGRSEVPLLEQTVIPSSIGDLRWTVFESASDPDSRRPPTQVWRGPMGYVSVQDGELLFSDDAVSWNVVDTPFPGTPLSLSRDRSGQYELTLEPRKRAVEVWRSPDLVTWQLAPNGSDLDGWFDGDGLVITRYESYLALPDGDALARVSFGLDLAGEIAQRIGDEDDRRLFAENSSETWSVRSESDPLSATFGAAVITTTSWRTWDEAKAGSVATVEVTASMSGTGEAWEIDVADPQSGDVLGTIRGSIGGSNLGRTLRNLAYGDLEAWFYIQGDTIELVQPEWADTWGDIASSIQFVTTADGPVAFVGAGPAARGAPEVWRTTDGRSWRKLGDAEGLPGASVQKIVSTPDGRYTAVLYEHPNLTFMTSDDGLTWRPATRPPDVAGAFDSEVRFMGSGWLLLAGLDGQIFEVWTSPDGDVWEQVDTDELISRTQADLVWDVGSQSPGGANGAPGRGSTPDVLILTRSDANRVITWLVEIAR